jgi:hypothetical protein
MIVPVRVIGSTLIELETTVSGLPTMRFSCSDNPPKAVSSQWQATEQCSAGHFDGKQPTRRSATPDSQEVPFEAPKPVSGDLNVMGHSSGLAT